MRHFHGARFKVYNPALNLQRLISIHKNISGMDQETGVRNPVCAGIKKRCLEREMRCLVQDSAAQAALQNFSIHLTPFEQSEQTEAT